MRQEFFVQVEAAGWSRDKLKSLIESVDSEKRSIKSRLAQLSSEPRDGDPIGRERQALIRRMKDKSSFLTEEREFIRARLGRIKANEASLSHARQKKAGFSDAFLVAAEQKLDEDVFSEVEQMAALILGQS